MIIFQIKGSTLVANVEGRVDGNSANEFETSISSAIDGSEKNLICDFSDVSYVSSAGLRAILIIAKRFSKQEATFSICGLREPVSEVFRISGFDKIIKVHESQKDALEAARY